MGRCKSDGTQPFEACRDRMRGKRHERIPIIYMENRFLEWKFPNSKTDLSDCEISILKDRAAQLHKIMDDLI